MLNIAIFISGRLLGYSECLLPIINNLKKKYKIFLFFSINTFSLPINDRNPITIENIINDLKQKFGNSMCECKFEEYKYPKYIIERLIKNNIKVFSYNVFSSFYNDKKNFNSIEEYEINNNIKFDIICKMRSDLLFYNKDIDFNVDNKDDLIIHNKHVAEITHWGYKYIPSMISDIFAYGNKNSMKIYCSTYDWILNNNLNKLYYHNNAGEIYLSDSILQYIFYEIIAGGDTPLLTKEQIIDKYINNPYKIKINYLSNVKYVLLPQHVSNNFIVDINNVDQYTKSWPSLLNLTKINLFK